MIVVHMPPFPKARPRVTRGGTHTYMPAKYEQRREELQWRYLAEGGVLDQEGELYMNVIFVFRMPKSWSKKKRAAMNCQPCAKRPDLDNSVGAVMDALLADDSKVVRLQAAKVWGVQDAIIVDIDHV